MIYRPKTIAKQPYAGSVGPEDGALTRIAEGMPVTPPDEIDQAAAVMAEI